MRQRQLPEEQPQSLKRARHAATAKDKPRHKRFPILARWLAGIVAAVIATLSPQWVPAAVRFVKEPFVSNPGPPLIVNAEPTFLDDQGYTMATPVGSRPGPQLLHLMTQPGASSSARFLADVEAIGGVNVNVLSIRLIVSGNSSEGVRVIDIRPVMLRRTKPLGGTLFLIPPQAGNATIKMMFDLDEVNPVARTIAKPPCRMATQGDVVFCVPQLNDWPYPVQQFAGIVGGELDGGSPFFDDETIHLAKGEQQVLYIRAQAAHFYAAFDLEFDYIVGTSSADVHKLLVTNNGQLFRVTGMPAGARPNTVSYQEAFDSQGAENLCPVSDPDLIPMGATAQIPCQS